MNIKKVGQLKKLYVKLKKTNVYNIDFDKDVYNPNITLA